MMRALVLAEFELASRSSQEAKRLFVSSETLKVISGALQLGMPVDLLIAGDGIGYAAEVVGLQIGLETIRVADHPSLANASVEGLTELLAIVVGDYTHIIGVAAGIGRDVIPRLAAKLDVMPITDVVAVHAPNRFDRPIYAGNAIETIASDQSRQLLTLRPSAFPFPPTSRDRAASTETVDVPAIMPLVELLATHRTESDRPDLATARIVVGGGVAVGSAEGFRLIEELADVLGAAVGATRAAVDAGYAPNDWQVGQTGKVIAPDLYIAIGISGALQHLAGIQGARTIIAINTDPEAPLMQLADYRLVGDLFTLVPALISALRT